MSQPTPLRRYLDHAGQTAEAFAGEHGLSAWSVRHWARGDKLPSLPSQLAVERATAGKVTPEAWLAHSLNRPTPASAAEAA